MAELSYRLMRAGDRPALRRLWSEETHWGEMPEDLWDHWFVHGPHGPALVVVAEDDGGVAVGQLAFVPTALAADRELVPAWRATALVLGRAHRRPFLGSAVRHPFPRMLRHGAEELRRRGERVLFGMPTVRLAPVIRRLPGWSVATFPLFSRPPSDAPPLSPGYRAVPLEGVAEEEVDRLCARVAAGHPCSVVKRADVLRWRARGADYRGVAVTRAGRLEGVATVRLKRAGKPERRQLDVCAVLAAGEGARAATLGAALAHGERLAEELPADDGLAKVTLLVTPELSRAAAALGFARDDYRFAVAVHDLGGGAPAAALDPGRWYVGCDD